MCARYYTSCCTQQHCLMHFIAHSQVCSQDTLKHIPHHTLKYTPHCTGWDTPSLHENMLPSKLSRRSQVHSKYDDPKYPSEYVLKQTPDHALKNDPNYTRWHTPNLRGCTLLSKLSWCSQVHSEYEAPKRTSQYVLKYTSEHDLNMLPSTLQECSQVCLQLCSQVHSQACCQELSQLHWMAYSQPAKLYAPR